MYSIRCFKKAKCIYKLVFRSKVYKVYHVEILSNKEHKKVFISHLTSIKKLTINKLSMEKEITTEKQFLFHSLRRFTIKNTIIE